MTRKKQSAIKNELKRGSSDEESLLLENSVSLVKKLSSEVKNIVKSKDDIKNKIKDLESRLSKKSVPSVSRFKTELLSEIDKVFGSLKPDSIKNEIKKSVLEVVDNEFAKFKSEINLKLLKDKREFNKRFSELEKEIIDVVRDTKLLSGKFRSLKKDVVLSKTFEERVSTIVKNFSDLFKKDVIAELKGFGSLFEDFNKRLLNCENVLKKVKKLEKTDEKKVIDLMQKIGLVKKEYEKILDEFKDLIDLRFNTLEKDVNKKISSVEIKVKKLNTFKEKFDENLENKINVLLDNSLIKVLDKVNVEFQRLEKKILELNEIPEEIMSDVVDMVNKERKDILEIFNKSSVSLKSYVLDQIANCIKRISNDHKDFEDRFSKFKINLTKYVESYLKSVDNEFKVLKKSNKDLVLKKRDIMKEFKSFIEKEFEKINKDVLNSKKEVCCLLDSISKEKEKLFNYLEESFNDIVDRVESELLKYEAKFNSFSKKGLDSINLGLDEIRKEFKRELSKEILKNNEFRDLIKSEVRDFELSLKEEFEKKFCDVEKDFTNAFERELEKFKVKISEIEDNYAKKFEELSLEKRDINEELFNFKDEVFKYFEEFKIRINHKFDELVFEKLDFEKEKKLFYGEVDQFINIKKEELSDFIAEFKDRLLKLVEEERESYKNSEVSFRNSFVERINALHRFFEERFNEIESKFVEKGFNVIKKRLEKEAEFLKLYEERLNSKEEELNSFVSSLDDKAELIHAEFKSEFNSIKEKIEERFMSLEKSFNKRFLNYDLKFSDLKRILIEEVEDVLKDVDRLFIEKEKRLNAVIKEIEKEKEKLLKVVEFYKENEVVLSSLDERLFDLERCFRTFRDSKEKFVKSLVEGLRVYEDSLCDLISSLTNKGHSYKEIYEVLIKKGHPKFYVMMVLSNYKNLEMLENLNKYK